jgi:hypothetical protein
MSIMTTDDACSSSGQHHWYHSPSERVVRMLIFLSGRSPGEGCNKIIRSTRGKLFATSRCVKLEHFVLCTVHRTPVRPGWRCVTCTREHQAAEGRDRRVRQQRAKQEAKEAQRRAFWVS